MLWGCMYIKRVAWLADSSRPVVPCRLWSRRLPVDGTSKLMANTRGRHNQFRANGRQDTTKFRANQSRQVFAKVPPG